jgi:hypothetical protein
MMDKNIGGFFFLKIKKWQRFTDVPGKLCG